MQAMEGLQSMEVVHAVAQAAEVPLQKAGPHSPSGSVFAGMFLQVPSLPGRAHAAHVSVHAVLQQTPSAHVPLAQ
jgi:hypothetical protein